MRLISILLMIVLRSAPANAEERRASSIVAGAQMNGISTALQGPQSAVHIGDPIPVVVELRNSSQQDVHLLLGTRGHDYLFRVVDESSNSAVTVRSLPKILGGVIGGPSAGRALAPGFSHYVDLNLADFIDIAKPGKYRVR
jgi:hypothetical protein